MYENATKTLKNVINNAYVGICTKLMENYFHRYVKKTCVKKTMHVKKTIIKKTMHKKTRNLFICALFF